MPTITLTNGSLRAEIDPQLGAGIADFSIRGPNNCFFPILRRAASDADHFNDLACYLLAPWPNRIAGAAFPFGSRQIKLAPDWPDGSAIHGDAKHRPFEIRERSPISALLTLDTTDTPDRNWPWPYHCAVRYELSESALTIELALTNLSDSEMPAGLGFHPYWMRRLWDDNDEVIVSAIVSGRYPAKNMIPTGPAAPDPIVNRLGAVVPLGDLQLDDVFAGFDGQARIEWPESKVRIDFECSPNLDHLVIYSPARENGGPLPWFCVEPVTMVNDGFNMAARRVPKTGATIVSPGGTLDARVTFRVTHYCLLPNA